MKRTLLICFLIASVYAVPALAGRTGLYAGQTPQHAIATAQLSVVGLAAAIGGKSDPNTVAALKTLVNKPGYTATKSTCSGKEAWAVRAPHLSALKQAEYVRRLLKLEPKLAAITGAVTKQITMPIMVTAGGAQLTCS
jgi:hypothetical protein